MEKKDTYPVVSIEKLDFFEEKAYLVFTNDIHGESYSNLMGELRELMLKWKINHMDIKLGVKSNIISL